MCISLLTRLSESYHILLDRQTHFFRLYQLSRTSKNPFAQKRKRSGPSTCTHSKKHCGCHACHSCNQRGRKIICTKHHDLPKFPVGNVMPWPIRDPDTIHEVTVAAKGLWSRIQCGCLLWPGKVLRWTV